MRPALSASSRSVTIRPLLAIIATSLRRQRPPGRGLVSSRAAGLARATGMPRSWCGASRWWDHKASDAPAGPIGVTGSPAGWGGHAPLHRLAHSICLRTCVPFLRCRPLQPARLLAAFSGSRLRRGTLAAVRRDGAQMSWHGAGLFPPRVCPSSAAAAAAAAHCFASLLIRRHPRRSCPLEVPVPKGGSSSSAHGGSGAARAAGAGCAGPPPPLLLICGGPGRCG